MSISESGSGVRLSSSHVSEPQSFVRKVMAIPMSLLFNGVARKALLKDLNDIKTAVERNCATRLEAVS